MRLENGLQLAWVTNQALTRQTNDFLRGICTFPRAFLETPAVVFTLRDVNTTPNLTYITLNRLGAMANTSAELVAYRMLGQTSFASGDTATAAALAIGRWK